MAEKKKKPDSDGNIFAGGNASRKSQKGGVSAGNNSIVISGNVHGSNVILGNNNYTENRSVNIVPIFEEIYRQLYERKDIKPAEKNDIRAELQEIQTALEDPKPDETFLARRFRNIQRMAPDIVDVAFETLKNPISGVATVIQKIAKKWLTKREKISKMELAGVPPVFS
jgi:hypothetical protein